MQVIITLQSGTGNDIYLRPSNNVSVDIYLQTGSGNDVYLRPPGIRVDSGVVVPPPSFPTQYSGLRAFYGGTVKELCLVAEADAVSEGGIIKIDKNGTKYAVYLVDTADTNASSIRINTTSGIKSIRLKT